jgi:acetyl esterase/lipase
MRNVLGRKFCMTVLLGGIYALSASAQSAPVKLWPNGVPGLEAGHGEEITRLSPEGEHILSNIQEPSITPYLPRADVATGAAVIIAPGGGHSEIWIDHEGYAVAEWLSNRGVAAFVLKYRLARQQGSKFTVEGEAVAGSGELTRRESASWDSPRAVS